MNVLIPLLIGLALFLIAVLTYPQYLSRLLGINDKSPTPAIRLEDGRDYVPTRSHVVFAHHFAVIAGAGPIVGPALALAFGFGPAWLWIVIGSIFFGAVHDMVSMFVSMREDGRSMADMSRRTLGRWGYFLFLAFLVMILTLINAIFLNMSCKALTSDYPLSLLKLDVASNLLHTYPKLINGANVMVGRIGGIATTSVFVITLVAPLVGYLIHKKRWSVTLMYIFSTFICILSVLAGFKWPIFLDEGQWRWIMSGYIFIACWIPVWLILQPRDFVNVQILYGGVLVMIVGVIALGLRGAPIGMELVSLDQGARLAGPIWPALFITVACGAISGFHSLASTGTTVKQIKSERDVGRIGYNAMILEGVLALATLALIATALPAKEYLSIVYPVGGNGNPILAFSIAMGYMLKTVFGIPIAIGAVLGILVVEGFVVTTLDTAVRLCRYMLEELWRFLFGANTPRLVLHPLFNTLLAVGLMLFFALNSTIMSAWKIFGAGNQMIAALSMTVASVYLLQRGRKFWFALIPAGLMTVTTFVMLVQFIAKNLTPGATGPLVVSPKEKGPLVFASLLLIILGVGVVMVALKAFVSGKGMIKAEARETSGRQTRKDEVA